LNGCATAPPLTFIRTDGQHIRGNPALIQAYELDRTICSGETQKASLSGVTFHGGGIAGAIAQANRNEATADVMRGCLAQKGYVQVLLAEAEARSAEFRSTAQSNANIATGSVGGTAVARR
jgi:hypothetical protein